MAFDRVAELQRWEDTGALWRVVGRGPGTVTVALITCDGGEEVARFSSADVALLRFVDDRSGSDD